jgi:hypothetical protein
LSNRLALDHLVYAVPDLAIAIDAFHARLGIAPTLGGKHEGLGTHNAILPLAGETYIELMAADPAADAPKMARPFGLDTLTGTRLVTWAVRSGDLEADVQRAREQGYEPGIVLDMTRKEPGGETLSWKLSLRKEAFADGLLPFVIDWGDTEHPSIRAAASSARCELASFSAHHPDPKLVRGALDALGVDLDVVEGTRPGLAARVRGPAGDLALG